MNLLIKQTVMLSLSIIVISTAMGQQKTNASFQKALDESNKSLIALKNKQNEPDLKKLIDKTAPLFQESTDEITAPIIMQLLKDATATEQNMKMMEQQYPSKKSEFDISADLNAVPFPIASLVLAAKSNEENIYKPYFDRLEQRKKQLTEIAKRNDRYQEVYNQEGQAGLEKRAAAETDKNVLIQEMGGTEKLKNMTEAERKAAAEQMKAKLQQDPGMLTRNSGSADPGMKTMQQKLMSDPEYAKRFSKMSEDEKQVEIKKYMTTKPAQPKPGVQYTEKPQTGNADVVKSIEIDELLIRSQKRMEEATATYSRMTTQMDAIIEAMKSELAQWAGKTEKSIPIVELGEYGHDKDPGLMQAMEITRKHAYYYIAMQEMKMRAICWQQFKNGTRAAMSEFNNYVAGYKFGQGKDSQLFNGTYNDPKIAGGIAGYYGTMEDIARSSRDITVDSKNAQKMFEGKL